MSAAAVTGALRVNIDFLSDFIVQWQKYINNYPGPAESGYALPLQTV